MAFDYKAKLRKASFRGVVFGVQDVDTTIGRRNALHEYPLRDNPYGEDLGRKAREYSFNAFIMTPNDYAASAALVAALEDKSTPGTLVHPTLGAKLVIPTNCKHTYKNNEGGLEYFTLTFIEAGSNLAPSQVTDTQGASVTASTSYQSTAQTFFASRFNVSGYADFIAQGASIRLRGYANIITRFVGFGGGGNTNTVTEYAQLVKALSDFGANADTLVFDPVQLAADLNDLNAKVTASFGTNLEKALSVQKQIFTFGDDFVPIIATTNLRAIELDNQNQLITLVKAACLAQMFIILSQITFTNADDAINLRDGVDELAQQQLLTLADSFDDEIYTSLLDSLVAMSDDVTSRALALPGIKYQILKDTLPALVLAYWQYDDSGRDADIISRNNIVNPVFLPSNTSLAIVP